MKIALAGKGGSGKTTIAAGIAKTYSKNFKVLAIDADSSLNLSMFLGHGDIVPISEMRKALEEKARLPEGLVRMNPDVRDMIDKYSVKINNNLNLLAMGTVLKAGTGCLCPENAVLRTLLQELVLKRDEVVIIDLEAGLEPMSRGTVRKVDAILCVTEANYGSAAVTKKLLKFTRELGIKKAYVVANKIRSSEELEFLKENFDVFHSIPYNEKTRMGAFRGEIVASGMEELVDKLIEIEIKH
ncbi:MAG: hypothetical protein A7315_13975 [Candidatus Altiarchaeales archaeon WOR_SM1_79]|nr:MAG: hypothetical protein A7315_13975 [Candidatus Altiarchaeales archaeon WOR_SM1_79]